jgi:polyhydroxyalkanoate synthesis repressor PhaR
MLVKKYGNRRLYDTEDSRYVTLEELAEKVRTGSDVRVIDAKTGEDLTQGTLTQIILESRGAAKLLPIPLLLQLVRLGDDALADFFGRYVIWALDIYLQTRHGAVGLASMNPLGGFGSGLGAFARPLGAFFPGMGGGVGWEPPPPAPAAPPAAPAKPTPPPPTANDDVAELRKELEALKRSLGGRKKRR